MGRDYVSRSADTHRSGSYEQGLGAERAVKRGPVYEFVYKDTPGQWRTGSDKRRQYSFDGGRTWYNGDKAGAYDAAHGIHEEEGK